MAHLGPILCGAQLMPQAVIGAGHAFDARAIGRDRIGVPEMDGGRRKVPPTFVDADAHVPGTMGHRCLQSLDCPAGLILIVSCAP